MHTPINKLVVTLEKKLYDSRTFESGQTIYFDPSWHPEEYAMLKAKVISVPPGVINRKDYEGFKIAVNPGDEILIRYDVVFAYNDQPDRDSPIYKNLIFHFNEEEQRYEELWLCDILQVFAIIKDKDYYMINGHVMLHIISERRPASTIIDMPEGWQQTELKNKATVIAGGGALGLRPGQTVLINPGMVMTYQMDLFKFYIIKEQYILGLLV